MHLKNKEPQTDVVHCGSVVTDYLLESSQKAFDPLDTREKEREKEIDRERERERERKRRLEVSHLSPYHLHLLIRTVRKINTTKLTIEKTLSYVEK